MLHLVAIADLSGNTKATIDLCDTFHLFPYYRYALKKGIDFEFYKTLFMPTNMICYAANPNSFVIGSDGIIYKCSVAFDNPLNQIGYLRSGRMVLDYDKMKKWTRNGVETSQYCSKCKFLPVCFGKFCPLEKNINNREPCPPFKKYIDYYMQLFEKGVKIYE